MNEKITAEDRFRTLFKLSDKRILSLKMKYAGKLIKLKKKRDKLIKKILQF